MKILSRLHKTGRKFINIISDGITVLANQDNSVLLLPINTVDNYTIRRILSGIQFQKFHAFCSGCHEVGNRGIMYAGRFNII